MSEPLRDIYQDYVFPEDFEPRFCNAHIISHSPREIFITFGCIHPPLKKIKAVSQIIITREHLLELIMNLQSQLKKFDEDRNKEGTSF